MTDKKKQLTIWLKSLTVKKYGTIEGLNEPYIVAMATDGKHSGSVLADDKVINDLFADNTPVSKCIVTAVSPIYPKMRRGEPLPLMGKGLRLFGPVEINGPVQLHLGVLESDRDLRAIGTALQTSLKDNKVDKIVSNVADAAELAGSKWAIVAKALGTVFEKTIEILAKNEDDQIRTFSYGEDFYQTESPYDEEIPLVSNRYVRGTLLIEWDPVK